jgi:hypothetical protein
MYISLLAQNAHINVPLLHSQDINKINVLITTQYLTNVAGLNCYNKWQTRLSMHHAGKAQIKNCNNFISTTYYGHNNAQMLLLQCITTDDRLLNAVEQIMQNSKLALH